MAKMDIFTIIWGWMAELYCQGTLPGLLQPGNLPACKDIIGVYTFYTSDQAWEEIRQHPLFQELQSLVEVEREAYKVDRQMNRPGWDSNSNIIWQMEKSSARGNYMFFMPPDIILGNQSLSNMAQFCAEEKYDGIFYTFPKVDIEVYDYLEELLARGEALSNRKLVSIAMRGGGFPGTTTPIGENEWQIKQDSPALCIRPDRCSDDNERAEYSMTAKQRLVDWYSQNPFPHHGYDHFVPYWFVINGYSWHLITNSDIYFQLERGQAWQGGSGPWGHQMLHDATLFFGQITRHFGTIWRGEGVDTPPPEGGGFSSLRSKGSCLS